MIQDFNLVSLFVCSDCHGWPRPVGATSADVDCGRCRLAFHVAGGIQMRLLSDDAVSVAEKA